MRFHQNSIVIQTSILGMYEKEELLPTNTLIES